jgi:hypothetical protein
LVIPPGLLSLGGESTGFGIQSEPRSGNRQPKKEQRKSGQQPNEAPPLRPLFPS